MDCELHHTREKMALLLLQVVYSLAALLLSVYALNSLVTIWLYWRHRYDAFPCPPLLKVPTVTVQLPIYNELYVVARLIKSITCLEYPRDKLQIQILDDSTDETTNIARKLVKHYRAQGFDIELIHRSTRQGFKGGALREGLRRAKGEYIAIFDAGDQTIAFRIASAINSKGILETETWPVIPYEDFSRLIK